jgi:hypothetical protein
MIFTATRFENTANMRCEADNIVMRNKKEDPLHETFTLEVFCEALAQFASVASASARRNRRGKLKSKNEFELWRKFHSLELNEITR